MFSERVDRILDELRDRACISRTSLIPNAYYNLISKEVPPHYFVQTLAETGIGEKLAASVAKAIKERILESERYPLFRWGIDISEIKVNDAEDVENLGLEDDLKKEEEKTIPLEAFEEPEAETIPIIKSATIPAKPALAPKPEGTPSPLDTAQGKPFILQEKPKEDRAPKGIGGRSIPSLSFGFFKSKRSTEPAPLKAVTAEVQTPAETKRVVHYTEDRSTLSPFEQGGEFLKTEEIATPIAPMTKTIIKPELVQNDVQEEGKSAEGGAKIEGNTIDLRL